MKQNRETMLTDGALKDENMPPITVIGTLDNRKYIRDYNFFNIHALHPKYPVLPNADQSLQTQISGKGAVLLPNYQLFPDNIAHTPFLWQPPATSP